MLATLTVSLGMACTTTVASVKQRIPDGLVYKYARHDMPIITQRKENTRYDTQHSACTSTSVTCISFMCVVCERMCFRQRSSAHTLFCCSRLPHSSYARSRRSTSCCSTWSTLIGVTGPVVLREYRCVSTVSSSVSLVQFSCLFLVAKWIREVRAKTHFFLWEGGFFTTGWMKCM